MVINLGEQNSLFNQYISEIRDRAVQQDSMRFRRNLERMGEIFAYEISKKLNYVNAEVTTPLGITEIPVLEKQPVIGSILRAGLPFHQGMLNYFDKAENAFVSSYRKYSKDGTFSIKSDHISSPPMDGKTLILVDPMLATGASMVLAYKAIVDKGIPEHVHLVSIIASKEGVEHVQKMLAGKKSTIWIGAIDDELTVKSYIVPGLGDAGDLAYGGKC